jgi:hypothetical protein
LLVEGVVSQAVGVGFSGAHSESVRALRRHEWLHAATQGAVVGELAAARSSTGRADRGSSGIEVVGCRRTVSIVPAPEGATEVLGLSAISDLWSGCWVPVDVARLTTNTPTDWARRRRAALSARRVGCCWGNSERCAVKLSVCCEVKGSLRRWDLRFKRTLEIEQSRALGWRSLRHSIDKTICVGADRQHLLILLFPIFTHPAVRHCWVRESKTICAWLMAV